MPTHKSLQKKAVGKQAIAPASDLLASRPFAVEPISTESLPTEPVIQPKLTLGQPGDKYEQEADRVAMQVVQQIHQTEEVARQCLQCQSQPDSSSETIAPELETDLRRSQVGGEPLPQQLQTQMGSALGYDLSPVRVHTGDRADQFNQQLTANAFTMGNHIFFKRGEYNPNTQQGQGLIAHEVTHVVQQGAVTQQRLQRKLDQIPKISMRQSRLIGPQRSGGDKNRPSRPELPTADEFVKKWADGHGPGTKVGGSAFEHLLKALDDFHEIDSDNIDATLHQLALIQGHMHAWRTSKKRGKGKKGDDKKEEALEKLESAVNQLISSITGRKKGPIEDDEKEKIPRRGPTKRIPLGATRPDLSSLIPSQLPSSDLTISAPVESPSQILKKKLQKLGYKDDRNFMSFHGDNAADVHVGWKAHVGAASPEDVDGIIDAVSGYLQGIQVSHKFDFVNINKTNKKFLTIYPPLDEGQWAEIISNLEKLLSGFGRVETTEEIPVGKSGKVNMRHGQITPLTIDMVKDLDVKETGSLGKFPLYTGKDIADIGLPLLLADDGKLFFSKSDKSPAKLSPDHVFMAILYNGKVIPDRREEANPAKAPLPSGVVEFDDK